MSSSIFNLEKIDAFMKDEGNTCLGQNLVIHTLLIKQIDKTLSLLHQEVSTMENPYTHISVSDYAKLRREVLGEIEAFEKCREIVLKMIREILV
jgi:hypothetical protein